jgi:hypothetical protein
MIVLGLLVLLAVGGLAARPGLLGHHLSGPGSRLFFFGLVLAAAAMSGLARMVAGLAGGVKRPPAPRQLRGGNTDRGH